MPDAPVPAEPNRAITVLDALQTQLELKLEERKRSRRVIVGDHLEKMPTDN
jgi:uncharacterized protein (TIGR03435 family)